MWPDGELRGARRTIVRCLRLLAFCRERLGIGCMPMNPNHPNDPLHGVTLEMMLNELSAYYGWAEMGRMVRIRCFQFDPSVKSSLTFLRKTPWARKATEDLYCRMLIAKSWDRPPQPAE